MEAFDFAFVLSNSDPNIINLLLLIKVLSSLFSLSVGHAKTSALFVQAIALFNAGRHNDAVRRVQDLTTAASQHSNSIPCGVVNVSLVPYLTSLLTLDQTLSRICACSLQ
jgi:hypothetical protein